MMSHGPHCSFNVYGFAGSASTREIPSRFPHGGTAWAITADPAKASKDPSTASLDTAGEDIASPSGKLHRLVEKERAGV